MWKRPLTVDSTRDSHSLRIWSWLRSLSTSLRSMAFSSSNLPRIFSNKICELVSIRLLLHSWILVSSYSFSMSSDLVSISASYTWTFDFRESSDCCSSFNLQPFSVSDVSNCCNSCLQVSVSDLISLSLSNSVLIAWRHDFIFAWKCATFSSMSEKFLAINSSNVIHILSSSCCRRIDTL
ncbi:hypothetical protein OGAPHI_003285 [Ogataea philodendri]|uniref:Uncharacterized protein n=1 Tax=Ogataea philodendri TaxID=1378263 RepID=A0A9P8P835_9ASCO|nr:uncharacterized protein OGAPHI_003285 [Ogataea philodendri]KAH3666836.1 hypothetical protein OGAPHI_003285 [Ogataea philodendri]